MPYVPPALRNKPNYKPKKLKLRPVIDYTKLKTKVELFEEYRKQNYGKADDAWNENEFRGIRHIDI
jgi:hypothetical protein